MRTNRLTARVAAHNLRQHVSTLGQAADLGAASDVLIDRTWRRILAVVKHFDASWLHVTRAEHAVRRLLVELDLRLTALFDERLTRIALKAHDETADTLSDQVPLQSLHSVVTESRLMEDDTEPQPRPGIVQLGVSPLGTLTTRHLAAPLLNPDLSKNAKRDLAKSLIFDPPDAKTIRNVVYRGDWFKRLSAMTKLAAPEDIGKVIRQGFTAGKSMRDIARELLPVVDAVRSSANRIARNEVSRVAHQMQWDGWQEVKDLIVGYQVHAVDNGHHPTTRPEHAERHLTVYYKLPKAGQKGMNECPRPPQEADGSTAENCRCWLTVVMGEMPPLPTDVSPHPIDPEIAAPWFASASVRDKKAAVGAERYSVVRQTLAQQGSERKPEWFDFIDLATGLLLPADSILARLLKGVGIAAARRLLQK